MFNADRVNEWLLVGGDLNTGEDEGHRQADQIQALVAEGVTHVLDVRIEWSDERVWAQHAPQIQYLHLPIDDNGSLTVPEEWFQAVEDFADDVKASGGTLLAHCHMGVNRGPSAGMTALLHLDPDLEPQEAFLAIRKARPMSGLVYASQVGNRALLNRNDDRGASAWLKWERAYWTPGLRRSVHKGIAYFRSLEGGTVTSR